MATSIQFGRATTIQLPFALTSIMIESDFSSQTNDYIWSILIVYDMANVMIPTGGNIHHRPAKIKKQSQVKHGEKIRQIHHRLSL
jgi:hypothetical protein